MTVQRRLRKIVFISLPTVFVVTAVFAILVEAWVRSTWDPYRGTPGFFLSDAVRGQRLAANYTGWFAGVPVHINSLELRDPREYALAKKPNTFRILVLGDSVTFGHGSIYEHTYPYLVEQRLKAWRPDVEWQVWNAAVPGYNTSQELAQLLEVGDRFQPDLVVVGFFENDLMDNRPIPSPGPLARFGARALAFARRHVYSLELYKRLTLTAAWKLSTTNNYKLRVEHLATEEALLARAGDATQAPQQQLTAFERFSDDQVRQHECAGGMKPDPETIPAMERDPGFGRWVDAVRAFQALARQGRFRVVFFLNDAPPACGPDPESDYFYDAGTRAIDRFYARIMSDGTPVVSTYEAFMHLRPSQMPGASAHSLGNANAVKAEVLFAYLRDTLALPQPQR